MGSRGCRGGKGKAPKEEHPGLFWKVPGPRSVLSSWQWETISQSPPPGDAARGRGSCLALEGGEGEAALKTLPVRQRLGEGSVVVTLFLN